jgi:hypothetical protein
MVVVIGTIYSQVNFAGWCEVVGDGSDEMRVVVIASNCEVMTKARFTRQIPPSLVSRPRSLP